MMNKYNNWITRTLDVDLTVNGNGDVDVIVTHNVVNSWDDEIEGWGKE